MENKTTKISPPVELESWKLALKLLGGIATIILGAILSIISPIIGIAGIFWGVIWTLQALTGFVRKFKQSKVYPKIKDTLKKLLVVLLVCSIIVSLFNFIAGLSATTIIIILLFLILIKK